MDEFEIGDLVWAKMKGFSPWPGRVTTPKNFLKKPNLKTDVHCIFFFGTHNYAYIEKANINPYNQFKNKFEKSCKSVSFKEAIDDIETYMKKKEENPNFDPEENAVQSNASNDEDSTPDLEEEEEDEDDDEEEEEVEPEEEEDDEPKPKKRRKTSGLLKVKAKVEKEKESAPSTPTIEKNGPATKETPITKVETKTKTLDEGKPKREPSTFVLGFLGLGRMGRNIVVNLVASGHKVNIWNRTSERADALKVELESKHPGLVQVYLTPSEIARNSDIIFSCVTDFNSVKNIWYGEYGLGEVESFDGKGYVELTNVGTESSVETNKIISNKGGRYLEAQLQGGVSEAEEGKLVILVAGNEKLYDDCNSSFEAIGKTIFYLGKVGSASKMNLILQVMRGVAMVGLQESFSLASKCGLTLKDVLEIFNITTMNSPFLNLAANSLVSEDLDMEHTMKNIRADIKMALEFSDVLKQPLVMAAAANESILKHLNS